MGSIGEASDLEVPQKNGCLHQITLEAIIDPAACVFVCSAFIVTVIVSNLYGTECSKTRVVSIISPYGDTKGIFTLITPPSWSGWPGAAAS